MRDHMCDETRARSFAERRTIFSEVLAGRYHDLRSSRSYLFLPPFFATMRTTICLRAYRQPSFLLLLSCILSINLHFPAAGIGRSFIRTGHVHSTWPPCSQQALTLQPITFPPQRVLGFSFTGLDLLRFLPQSSFPSVNNYKRIFRW